MPRPTLSRFVAVSLGLYTSAGIILAATFPKPFDTETTPGGPMPAGESAANVTLPPGFRSTLFAGEPDVAQPIAMATDARGRLWVAENYTYSEREVMFHSELRDRIVIFEDTDNDGRFDKRTVFWDGAQRLTSIEIGLGGVWAITLPNLVFIPDRDGDDRPDGPPELILEGFDERARHNVANGLRWGPDGWLYGRHGILGNSIVGAPGTSADQRKTVSVGIWRFHPQRHTLEIVAEGTTNPWGMDWDARGEPFFINTVIGHLWQTIPGAHYRRMFGPDRNPHTYELIDQHADHVHWATGEDWRDVRKGVTDATSASGGGHAHTGLLIYQGGQWPNSWDGKLLTINFHGRRLNVERLERSGSAVIGRGEPDAFQFADPWFRGIDLIAAPDGGVFVSDWSDAGECHDNDGVHRSSGRIFKLSYGEPRLRFESDLTRRSGSELVNLQRSRNDWEARLARRLLADRAAAGNNLVSERRALEKIVATDATTVHRLRAIWALQVTGGLTQARLVELLSDRDEFVRVWAVRLLVDDRATPPNASALAALVALAKNDPSPSVRLALASALQRLPTKSIASLAAPLLARTEDVSDHNIPLMLWYGIESLATTAPADFDHLAAIALVPRVVRLAARRITEDIEATPARLDAFLQARVTAPLELRRAALDGVGQALSGRRQAPSPAHWNELRTRFAEGGDTALVSRLRDLSAVFGDGRALEEIRAVALDETADIPQRKAALQVLIDSRFPKLRALCVELLQVRELAALAVTGLGQVDDPEVADAIISQWSAYYSFDYASIMTTLVSRPAWAGRVLDAIAAKRLETENLSAAHIRQIRAFNDPELIKKLTAVWGTLPDEETSEANLIKKWQSRLTPTVLSRANRTKGRELFQARCAACHKLNGEGGAIGPDLTGAARDNLAYLLENIITPGAIVPDEYRLTTLTLKDGRVLAGVVRERSPHSITLQSMAEPMIVPLTDIAKQETSPLSLMPPGLIDDLNIVQVRDLMGYLMKKD